ncbi:MAG: hypothetical protein ACP5R5_03665 [Armatimonadota bacterium]
MGVVIFVSPILILITVLGIVKAIRSLRGVVRVVLVAIGLLLCAFLAMILAVAGLFYRYVPETTHFDPAAYRGPTGKIVTGLQGKVSLSLQRDERRGQRPRLLVVDTDNGTLTIPSGKYVLWMYDQEITRDGVRWRVTSRGPLRVLLQPITKDGVRSRVTSSIIRFLEVKPGGSLRLDIGPPYVASVLASSAGKNRVNISLEVVGRAGEYVSIVKGEGSEPPGFQILSMNGKVLQEGKFRYG